MTVIIDGDAGVADAVGNLIANRRVDISGDGNAIVLTTGYSLASIPTGMQLRFRALAQNTGAATINVDGLGAVPCVTITGVALPADYIRTDVDTVAVYDGSNFVLDRQIERGSNANGDYVKFADGLMRQYGDILETITSSLSWGSMFYNIGAFQDFPVPFVGTLPAVVYSSDSLAYVVTVSSFGMTSLTQHRPALMTSSSVHFIDGYTWSATGEWY